MKHNYDIEKVLEYARSHVGNTDEKKKFILDTDAYNEMDDQFAISYALLSPDIETLALTAAPFRNWRASSPAEGMEKSYHEMVKVRDLIDPEGKRNIPCYRGSTEYMRDEKTPVISEAAENIVRIAKETDDTIFVAVIGCFTNVASALLLDPSIADKIVVLMLGSAKFECGTAKEFNLEQDRAAAKVLFECGVPLIVFPAVGGVTDTLFVSNVETEFFLRGKAGEIGDFLCQTLVEFDNLGMPERENGECNSAGRPLFDIGPIGFLREPGAFGTNVIPAKSIDYDCNWVDLDVDRKMVYIRDVYRNYIVTDMFNIIRRAGK